MGQSAAGREIYLTIEAGQTQSLELFDFNSHDNKILINELITNNSFVSRNGDDIIYPTKNDISELLYTLTINHQLIELQVAPDNQKCLWRVLKSGEMHPLQNGTYIKLGKVKLRLKEVIEDQKEMTERDISRSLNHDLLEVKSMSAKSQSNKSNQEKICRICFEGMNDAANPLVSLCKCLGTVKYIHFECLKDWVSKNVVKRQQNNTLFYSYQEPKCEICQKYYQAEFMYQGKKFSLLDMERAPNPPYAIFQGIDYEDQSKRFSVFLIGLGEEEITIGRNSSSNVVMKEISVSRSHCSLLYKNKQLLIKDKGSKFGTLIKVEDEVEFSPTQGVSFQFESKLFTIRQNNKLSCCCAESDTYMLKIKKEFSENQYFQAEG